jgi:hypothetical protein
LFFGAVPVALQGGWTGGVVRWRIVWRGGGIGMLSRREVLRANGYLRIGNCDRTSFLILLEHENIFHHWRGKAAILLPATSSWELPLLPPLSQLLIKNHPDDQCRHHRHRLRPSFSPPVGPDATRLPRLRAAHLRNSGAAQDSTEVGTTRQTGALKRRQYRDGASLLWCVFDL